MCSVLIRQCNVFENAHNILENLIMLENEDTKQSCSSSSSYGQVRQQQGDVVISDGEEHSLGCLVFL